MDNFDLKKYLAEGKLNENVEHIQLKITSEQKKRLVYILEMKLQYYEDTGDEFFAEEIEMVTDILNQLK